METETIALEVRTPTSAPLPLDRKERLKRFGEAMDVIRERVEARVGPEDIAHVRRVDRFSRAMEVVGRVLIHFSVEPVAFSLGVGALWLHKQLQRRRSSTRIRADDRRRSVSPRSALCTSTDSLRIAVRLRLTPRGIKTLEHNGGLDAYLLGTNDSKLTPEMLTLKRRVSSAKAKKDAKKAA